MIENQIILTDYLANDESMKALRDKFSELGDEIDFCTFKSLMCSSFPVIAELNQLQRNPREPQKAGIASSYSGGAMKGFGMHKVSSTARDVSVDSKRSFVPRQSDKPGGKSSVVLQLDPVSETDSELFDTTAPLPEEEEKSSTSSSPSALNEVELLSVPPDSEYAKSSATPVPPDTEEVEVNREIGVGTKTWLRRSRHRSKMELTGQLAVEPLKAIFNYIDRRNRLNITWDDLVQYLVEESRHRSASMEETCRTYTFSRKMKGTKVEESWLLNNPSDLQSLKNEIMKKKEKKVSEEKIKTAWETYAPPVDNPELFLIHFVHGLPGHMMFAVSTRSTPLALFKKSDLSHVRSLTPDELGHTSPTIVDYLPHPDTIVSYSTDDNCIRGWTFLLSKNNTTSLSPLRVDGQVQRMRTCTEFFPYSVFIGTTLGHVVRVDVPVLRSGTELRIVQVYENLHAMTSGGVVDFAISETHIFTTGFDHRVLSINIQTGHTTVIGDCPESVYLLDYCPMFSLVLGVSYKNELLCWDAKGLAAVPGTVFNHALEKEHYHRIKRLICVKDLPHCLTVDCLGEVKMWDLRMQQCVQTTRVDGTATEITDPETIYGMKSKNEDEANVKTLQPIVDATYFDELHEMVSCTSDTVYLLQYNLREDVYLCDFDQVNQVFYDVREKTFVLQGSTRVSIWDAQGGYRKRVVDRALTTDIPPRRKDIAALCIDDVGSRIFISLQTFEIEIHDTKEMEVPLEILKTPCVVSQMMYSNYYKMLAGVSQDGTLYLRNEEERIPFTVAMKITSFVLYSLSISEPLGLLACADEKGYLFLHDIKKVENSSQMCRLDRRILCCELLGSAPILASAHDGGDICLWSCPPIAEVFLQLAVFNVCTKARSTELIQFVPIARDGEGAAHQSTPFNTHSMSLNSPLISHSSTPRRSDSAWGGKSFHLPRTYSELVKVDGRRRTLVQERNKKSSKSKAEPIPEAFDITAIAFDDDTHHFFCADSTGSVSIFSLCSFFQWFEIKPVNYESRTLYFLDRWGIGDVESMPRFIKTIHPHSREGILTIRWVPYEKVLLTTGADRKVFLFDVDGNECGVLSKARLPQRDTLEESKSSLHSSFNVQFRGVELPPYRIPNSVVTGTKRTPRKEKLISDADVFCRHPLLSKDSQINLPLPHEESMNELSDAEKIQYGSISSTKGSIKHTSAARLVDFVMEGNNTSSHASMERDTNSSPAGTAGGVKKEVFLKDSVATSLAATRAERNSKLAEEKVDSFPSTVRAETLSQVEENRSHSHATMCEKPLPVLFACQFEPTVELMSYYHNNSRPQSIEPEDLMEEEKMKRNIPQLVPVIRPLKRPLSRTPTKPKLEFLISGQPAVPPSEALKSEPFEPLRTSSSSRVGSSLSRNGHRINSSSANPSYSKGMFSKTLPNGIPPNALLESRKRQPAFQRRPQSQSSSRSEQRYAAVSQESQLKELVEEYNGELRRCIAGESAEQRGRMLLNPKLVFTKIGDDLKKVDHAFC